MPRKWTCPDTLADLWTGWASEGHVAIALAVVVGLFWLYGAAHGDA